MEDKTTKDSTSGLAQRVDGQSIVSGVATLFPTLMAAPRVLDRLLPMATTRVISPIRPVEGEFEIQIDYLLGLLNGRRGYIEMDECSTPEEFDDHIYPARILMRPTSTLIIR